MSKTKGGIEAQKLKVATRYISRSANIKEIQLGINAILIQDQYQAWMQNIKVLGRLIKKMKQEEMLSREKILNMYNLITTELFGNFFQKILRERKNNTQVPEDSIISEDASLLYKSLKNRIQNNYSVDLSGSVFEKKLFKFLEHAVKFINYAILIRPIGKFKFYQKNIVFNRNFHDALNPRGSIVINDDLELYIKKCIYPAFVSEGKCFVKAQVIVGDSKDGVGCCLVM